jgi:hypothetical protein
VRKWGYQNLGPLAVKLGVGRVPPGRDDADLELVRVWKPDTVAWRLQHPAQPYRVRRRDGRAHLYAPTGRFGIWVEIGSFPSAWIPESTPAFRPANPLRLWIGADPTRDFARSLYVDVPLRLRPSPLYMLFGDLTGRDRRIDPARFRYDVFDFDAY